MRTSRCLPVLLGLTVLLGGTLPLHAQQRRSSSGPPVTGRTLDLRISGQERLSGELIEATDDEVLLLSETGFRSVPFRDITSVTYERHGFGASDAFLWVGLGALVTGGGMAIACNQVEDTSCGGVFVGFALSWTVIGGLLAGSVAAGQKQALTPTHSSLRPYARFPQGAPEGFRETMGRAGAGSR